MGEYAHPTAMGQVAETLVACCGNPLAGDDAFGHLVAQELAKDTPPKAEIIDLAMNPASLLDHLEGRRVLIVVDAAQVPGTEVGELMECDWRDPNRPKLISESTVSTHGFSISDQLELASRIGVLPQVVRIVVVTIVSAQAVAEPTDMVKQQAVSAAARVRELIQALEAAEGQV